MFSLEILYAVLQGLPPEFVTFLDESWASFCRYINSNLRHGLDPVAALKRSIAEISDRQRRELRDALTQIGPIMELPGLTISQRQALLVLRQAKAASAVRLSRLLVKDPSNTRRCLNALVSKGHALKFYSNQGLTYMANPSSMDHTMKSAIHQLLLEEFSISAKVVDQGEK